MFSINIDFTPRLISSILYPILMFYVTCFCPLHPDNDPKYHESTYRGNHHAIIRKILYAYGFKHFKSKQSPRAQQLSKESHCQNNPGITKPITQSIEKRIVWLIAHGKCFESSHHNTIGNN